MLPPLISYYFLFVKKNKLGLLASTQFHRQSSLYQTKKAHDLLHRLALESILAGEYGSCNFIVPFICSELGCFDDTFLSPCFDTPDAPVDFVAMYTWYSARQILRRQSEFRSFISQSINDLDLSRKKCNTIAEEAADAFQFLVEICSLLHHKNYCLLIVSSPSPLTFPRFIEVVELNK